VGGDIQENKLTLPIIHALQHGSKETIAFIKLLLKKKNVGQKELFILQKQLMECGSVAYATEAMNQYAKNAQDLLAQFPSSDVSVSIHKLIQFTIERDK
jgi:octaprenyl-diphosphate synthase